jgi:hypothetical protein
LSRFKSCIKQKLIFIEAFGFVLLGIRMSLTGDKVPRELAASGIEHRNRAENRAVYGA